MTSPTPVSPVVVSVSRRIVAVLLLIGLWPVTMMLCTAGGVWTAEFLAKHRVFRWAPSMGDIGEGLMLLFSSPIATSIGYVAGIILGAFANRAARRWLLMVLLGAPFVFMLLRILGLAFGKRRFDDAAPVIFCGEYFVAVVVGVAACSIFRRIYGLKKRDAQAAPPLPEGRHGNRLWLAAVIAPCVVVGTALLALQITHSIQGAFDERACAECMEAILEAERDYYATNGKFANLVDLCRGWPDVEATVAANDSYIVEVAPGTFHIHAIPRGGKQWMAHFVVKRCPYDSHFTEDRRFVPVLVLTRERGAVVETLRKVAVELQAPATTPLDPAANTR